MIIKILLSLLCLGLMIAVYKTNESRYGILGIIVLVIAALYPTKKE